MDPSDLDLREELARGFGPEPDHPTPSAPGTTTAPQTVDPTPSTTTDPASRWRPGELARYDAAGELEARPGVTVLERIENPYDHVDPARSAGLDVTFRDEEAWLLLELTVGPDGRLTGTGTTSTVSAGWPSFAAWVADQVAVDGGGGADLVAPPVRFGEGEQLVAVDGVRIVLQQPHPDLPDSFAPPGSRTAVALVELADGSREWALARDSDGFDVVSFPQDPGQSLEAFLAFARQKYAEGVGLR